MSIVKVAVIGYGHLGKWHCEKVEACSEAELAYIVEPISSAQEVAKSKHPHTKIVSTLDECIKDIDAGIVVTPTIYHFSVVDTLLAAGKHVFCEKPVTSNYLEGEKLRSKLNSQIVFQVGHSERFHKLWQQREIFAPFLEQAHIEINRYAPFKGRATDVDVVQDLMIHDIDLLYFILGEYPRKVKARGYKIRTDKWDAVSAGLVFSSGVSAIVTAGRNHCVERRDVTITNSQGVCYINLMTEEVDIAWGNKQSVERKKFEKQDHLLIEHQNFYRSILEKKEAVVTFEEGLGAVKIVDAILASVEQFPLSKIL